MSQTLTAPFPWYGGKRRWAERVWEKLDGDSLGVYAEPFAGSLAVLLHRVRPIQREVVCDLDGMICNFWRAVTHDPEGVAAAATYPTIHQDLTARHTWLRAWKAENAERLSVDPDFYDVRVAGWWCWGLCLWIGGGWCTTQSERRPHVGATGGGEGISAQRVGQIPNMSSRGGAQGVAAQRVDKRPYIDATGGGQGIAAQRNGAIVQESDSHQEFVRGWCEALAARLYEVVVLNRDWRSALTPTVLQHTPASPKPPVGIFLDPPYLTDGRSDDIYEGDDVADATARESYEWAVEHGDRYRIAYASHAGDFPVPPGWEAETETFGAIKLEERRGRLDQIMFSPVCQRVGQVRLL